MLCFHDLSAPLAKGDKGCVQTYGFFCFDGPSRMPVPTMCPPLPWRRGGKGGQTYGLFRFDGPSRTSSPTKCPPLPPTNFRLFLHLPSIIYYLPSTIYHLPSGIAWKYAFAPSKVPHFHRKCEKFRPFLLQSKKPLQLCKKHLTNKGKCGIICVKQFALHNKLRTEVHNEQKSGNCLPFGFLR